MSDTATKPYACPNCGSTSDWKADYYEAVWQTVNVTTGDDGGPGLVEYTGVTGTYDDPSTPDERLRCGNCVYEEDLQHVLAFPALHDAIARVEALRANNEKDVPEGETEREECLAEMDGEDYGRFHGTDDALAEVIDVLRSLAGIKEAPVEQ